MQTPRPKYFCPKCRAAYDADQHFCGKCGADMHRASSLAATDAQQVIDDPGRAETEVEPQDGESDSYPARPFGVPMRSADESDRWIGTVVDNRYRVLEQIGRGGMGMVYKVEHQRMGKIAAMKVLHHDLSRDREVLERFRREAEAVSRLNHPNTVQVFDFGNARGAMYLVMEYVKGEDLGTRSDRLGPIPFHAAAPIFAQVCAALTEAHAQGVIHRDLKPENIIVTRTQRGVDFVKVLDFGLAKLGEREELGEVTGRGAIVGTPYYMSPEQIRGDHIDARADVYSMGALMYRILTGRPVFSANSPVGVLTKHLTEPLVLPSQRAPDMGVDPQVDELLVRALAKKRDDRIQTAAELLAAIEEVYDDVTGDISAKHRLPVSWNKSSSMKRPAFGPTVDLEDDDAVDYGIESDLRLRRTDLDSFERSLRWRRRLRVVLLPLLLAVAAAGGYWMYLQAANRTLDVEEEVNNTVESANRIAPATVVTGFLGKRVAPRQPDVDFYRVAVPGKTDSVVSASVSGLPNIDVTLSIYDSSGTLLGERDGFGLAAGETLRRLRASGDAIIVVVGQAYDAADDGLPVENVSDAYQLRVDFAAADEAWESEPNDSRTGAIELAIGREVRGHLDDRSDVDYFKFSGNAGRYTVEVAGDARLPLRWSVGDGAAQSQSAEVTLAPDSLIKVHRADARSGATDKPTDKSVPGAELPYSIRIRR